jgi:simple sugar transport system ATP-binding protein
MGITKQQQVVLETHSISKKFPRVLANDDISIKLYEKEILSLLGENGAGKSTLMNVLYGLYKPTEGSVSLHGTRVEFSSPKDAIDKGLGMVHQHFMLVDTLSVTENIILGAEPGSAGVIDYKKARKQVVEISGRYKLKVDPDELIENLSVGLQQRVEILKALYRQASILILDEPTAVLTPQEVDELFEVVRSLRDGGVSVIIITHKLDEVMEISDRCYVLRRGKLVGERSIADTNKEELANLMVGRDVVLTVSKDSHTPKKTPVFTIKDLVVLNEKRVRAVDGLSLEVRPGEIVGIAGVDGNGQDELAESIMGLIPIESGTMQHEGEDIGRLSTKERILKRISFVPADRRQYGLVLPMTVAENIVIGYHDRSPFSTPFALDYAYINSYADKLVVDFDIRTPSSTVAAETLSGGNQQKVILAREFSRDPSFLLVSQPTRGLDVGAIEYIHSQILAMRKRDVGVLLISLELEEIFALADRILVLYEGKIVKELIPENSDEKEVGLYMTGGNR